jgi:dethiobiotin synthetase
MKALEMPLILVAADRLGVINHTLLTVEALYRRGLEVLAIVLVRLSETADLSSASNADVISRHTGLPLVQVPYEAEEEAPVREVFADAGERAAFNALKPFFPVIMEGVEKRYNIVKRLYISGGKKKTDQD